MQGDFASGVLRINNSITNTLSIKKDWIDANSPLSFFDFIKNVDLIGNSPREINNAYNLYLHRWYEIVGNTSAVAKNNIKNQYVELLREISTNFTTNEEKKFLQNIDFNSEQDLNIAIPFFSNKLSEICQFYTRKRELAKHKIYENQIKGTTDSLNKKIFNIIYDYVFSNENYNTYNTSTVSLSSLAKNLDIEIEELFDIYSEYFNIDSDLPPSNYTQDSVQREDFFTANSNYLDFDLFVDFEASLKREIFSKPIIIQGLELFSVNYSPDFIDLICTPENPLEQIIESNEESSNLKLQLRKRVLQKYLGTDVYYLSTNSTLTQASSGILAKADAPAKNLLNQRFPATASIPSQSRFSARDIGLFFKPDKLGITTFKTQISRFDLKNIKTLEPNKIYIFPDPDLYGNISNISEDLVYKYPLVHITNESFLKKSNSYTFAAHDIYSTPYDSLHYGYCSYEDFYNKQQNIDNLSNSFLTLYNKGIITRWKHDIFGNEYGLLKDVNLCRRGISAIDISPKESSDLTKTKYIVLDGHVFYDLVEGFAFNYSTIENIEDLPTSAGTIRTGISAKTIDESPYDWGNYETGYPFSSGSMFDLAGTPVYPLYFREFFPYIEATYSGNIKYEFDNAEIYDGGAFTFGDDIESDPIPADSPLYVEGYTNFNFYYTELIDGGVNANTPGLPPVSGTSSFLSTLPTTNDTRVIDGKSYKLDVVISDVNPYLNQVYSYIENVPSYARTTYAAGSGNIADKTLDFIQSFDGTLFVKNISTNRVSILSAEMKNIFAKYNNNVITDINASVNWFDVVYDTIFIQTKNYFIIEKIAYEEGVFKTNNQPSIYYPININSFEKISIPFFSETKKTSIFARMILHGDLSATNEKIIYPEIYKYEYTKHLVTKLYPTNTSSIALSGQFSYKNLGVNIENIKSPKITYNTRNNFYALTYIAEDGNGASYIIYVKFTLDEESSIVSIISVKAYKMGGESLTYNFYQTTSSTLVSSSTTESSPYQNISTGEFIFN